MRGAVMLHVSGVSVDSRRYISQMSGMGMDSTPTPSPTYRNLRFVEARLSGLNVRGCPCLYVVCRGGVGGTGGGV